MAPSFGDNCYNAMSRYYREIGVYFNVAALSPSCTNAVKITDVMTTGSKWYNELGSVMTIDHIDVENGDFCGTYCSAVGQAEKEYPLSGRLDTEGFSLGWVVTWKNQYMNAFSTTSWSGQYQVDPVTRETVIVTTWLLTAQSTPQDDWNSTNVGFDEFLSHPCALERTERVKQRRQTSHPKSAA